VQPQEHEREDDAPSHLRSLARSPSPTPPALSPPLIPLPPGVLELVVVADLVAVEAASSPPSRTRPSTLETTAAVVSGQGEVGEAPGEDDEVERLSSRARMEEGIDDEVGSAGGRTARGGATGAASELSTALPGCAVLVSALGRVSSEQVAESSDEAG